ncbi:hypothetical protein [Clostridium estertheticum]|uniref:hypothetical protein n=1 Tax=Clostridium estertheticum TaxID=238834 RepID=UPI001C0BE2E6|nr:hypothetical protein [Clostridium estertheticum]MBU3186547.1 hypothetical protein [Clostridium estertheticum]
MKCRYKYCTHESKDVDKEDAVKDGTSYFHKDCFKQKSVKQEIEAYYIENLPTTAIQLLRKAINILLNENPYSAEYVLFIIKKIHVNNLVINNPFGIAYYCHEGRNIKEWKKIQTNIKFKEIKNEIVQVNDDENKVKFTYKPNKKWNDLI